MEQSEFFLFCHKKEKSKLKSGKSYKRAHDLDTKIWKVKYFHIPENIRKNKSYGQAHEKYRLTGKRIEIIDQGRNR